MITFACVWVRGHIDFPKLYVERLRDMISRRVNRRHQIICLTDQPRRVPPGVVAIQAYKLPSYCKAWWTKVQLFDPALHEVFPKARFVYMDLDVLLVNPIDDILDFKSDFALIPDAAPDFHGMSGLITVKRFNSSVMVFASGSATEIFTQFDPRVALRLWGDQDWIGELLPKADKMPVEWFPRMSAIEASLYFPPEWPKDAKIVLMKKPKNLKAQKTWPWFDEEWR